MANKVFSPANFIKHWAQQKPNSCFLRQPINGKYVETSWMEAYSDIAKLAAYLKKFPSQSKIGIYSNNCRDWFIADMAIMAAGHISVPIYPTANGKTITQILEHSETKLVFVGKLQQPINFSPFEKELELVAIHQPLEGISYWKHLTEDIKPVEEFYHPTPEFGGDLAGRFDPYGFSILNWELKI